MTIVDDLPDLSHWKHVKEFSLNDAALLLAGIDPLDYDMKAISRKDNPRWKLALGMLRAIKSSIRQGSLAIQVAVARDWNGNAFQCSPTSYENELDDDATLVTRAALMGWIEREKIDFARPASTKVSKPTQYAPILEGGIRLLPSTHHNSKGIELIKVVNEQFYATYDPDDKNTAPKKEEVVKYLSEKHGASKNLATAVDVVMRPEDVKGKGRPPKK